MQSSLSTVSADPVVVEPLAEESGGTGSETVLVECDDDDDEGWGTWKPDIVQSSARSSDEPDIVQSSAEDEWMQSWERLLDEWGIDAHSRLQLKLLTQVDKVAGADVIWKLTKTRDDPITNPSAFVSRCITQARKELMDRRRW